MTWRGAGSTATTPLQPICRRSAPSRKPVRPAVNATTRQCRRGLLLRVVIATISERSSPMVQADPGEFPLHTLAHDKHIKFRRCLRGVRTVPRAPFRWGRPLRSARA
jgi:hypothetical protein